MECNERISQSRTATVQIAPRLRKSLYLRSETASSGQKVTTIQSRDLAQSAKLTQSTRSRGERLARQGAKLTDPGRLDGLMQFPRDLLMADVTVLGWPDRKFEKFSTNPAQTN